MQRRRFLALTAPSTSAFASALAGCTGAASPGDGTTTRDDSGTHPTTTVPPCPAVRDVSRTVCPGDEDAPITVSQSAREMPADGGTLTVTVENTSDGEVGLNPYAWGVYKRTDDGHWDRVDDDRVYIEPWQILKPGDTLEWRVASDADAAMTGGAIVCALDLSPGTYGWTVELAPAGTNQRIAAGAGFVVQ